MNEAGFVVRDLSRVSNSGEGAEQGIGVTNRLPSWAIPRWRQAASRRATMLRLAAIPATLIWLAWCGKRAF